MKKLSMLLFWTIISSILIDDQGFSTESLKFWQVDAFTEKPFKGNAAAIFILKEPLEDELMQNIAAEKNLSETAFVLLRQQKNPLLRWFTPTFEIDLCGHATLASAHIYFSELFSASDSVTFDTKSVGQLTVTKGDSGYTMDFPSRPGEMSDLSSVPQFVYDSLTDTKPIEAYQSRDLMLVYDDEAIIGAINPNFNALMPYDHNIIVTAKSKTKFDFISRFFCTGAGFGEDPVTGSAHCTLAPYWSRIFEKDKLFAYQASKRGGELTLTVKPDRIYISGQAVTVFEGIMKHKLSP